MSTYQSKYTGAEIDNRLEWAEEINPHKEDKDNPHEVTAEQVGAVALTAVANTLTETEPGKVLDARQGKALSDNIGNQTYDQNNYIADGESATSSINKLDIQLKKTGDIVSTNTQFTDVDNVVYSWRFIKSAEGHMQLEYTEVI